MQSEAVIGLAIGEGTGPELAAIFERALGAFADAAQVHVHIDKAPTLYRSFGGVIAAGLSAAEVAQSSDEDAATYIDYLHGLVARGGRAVFRTAFNAQPLYVVRERLRCAKVETLPNDGGRMVLVRDQAQGFFAGDNDRHGSSESIERTCRFSRATTNAVLDFAIAEGAREFGGVGGIDAVVMAYKFHLLDLRFAHWVEDYARDTGVDVRVFQPDTVNRNLLRGTYRGKNVVIVGGNEWGDIMHADILARAGLGNQDERCSRNVYLLPGLGGLTEYQTVHGSADDIAGRERVNPTATLRAAAQILEAHVGVPGLMKAVEVGVASAAAAGIRTPDVGGTAGTNAVAEAVITRAIAAWRDGVAGVVRGESAVVIVDMQRDFVAPDGRFAQLGIVDGGKAEALLPALATLVAGARRAGLPILFVRTLGDAHLLPANVAQRHARQGRGGYLRAGEPGSEFYGVQPLAGDEVITKVGYDAFVGTELEARLVALGVRHLIVGGVFSELCVDAIARTGFQKGYRVSVVSDATMPLERAADEVLGFMQRYYDVAIVTAATAT